MPPLIVSSSSTLSSTVQPGADDCKSVGTSRFGGFWSRKPVSFCFMFFSFYSFLVESSTLFQKTIWRMFEYIIKNLSCIHNVPQIVIFKCAFSSYSFCFKNMFMETRARKFLKRTRDSLFASLIFSKKLSSIHRSIF